MKLSIITVIFMFCYACSSSDVETKRILAEQKEQLESLKAQNDSIRRQLQTPTQADIQTDFYVVVNFDCLVDKGLGLKHVLKRYATIATVKDTLEDQIYLVMDKIENNLHSHLNFQVSGYKQYHVFTHYSDASKYKSQIEKWTNKDIEEDVKMMRLGISVPTRE